MREFIAFREETNIIKMLDETCKALGVSRSDYLRVTLRRALCGYSENEEKAPLNDQRELVQGGK